MINNSGTNISTPDICDAHEAEIGLGLVKILDGIFTNYGKRDAFFGEVVTIKCFEDNSVLKQLVETAGHGRVIVMDGGGSLRKAILGDMLADKAANNGWSGLVINGCIRDCDEIATTEIGVKALNTHPMKTVKLGIGDLNVAVTFAGHTIRAGHWLYSDSNGIVVSEAELSL